MTGGVTSHEGKEEKINQALQDFMLVVFDRVHTLELMCEL